MNRAEHLERLRKMLQQVTPVSPFEATSSGFESLELPGESLDAAAEGMRRLNANESVPNDAISEEQQSALEAIVLPKLRPVINIVNNTFSTLPFPWEHFGSGEIKSRIEKAIPSIGRVEIPGHPSIPYGGTGFVVGPNLIMTNRHVAEIFATGLGERRLAFISGRKSALDFKREVIATVPELVSVKKIVMIHPFWDMALLQVDGLSAQHPVLTLSVKDPRTLADSDVAVIGYPAQDWRNNVELQAQIFGGVFNVKRLQPGKLKAVRPIESFGHDVQAVTHDASTLGGNSGSAVIDVSTGEVVALHFAGLYLDANFAVPSFHLARDTRVVQAGVKFSGNIAPTTDWAAVWKLADGTTETSSPAANSVMPAAASPSTVVGGPTMTWTIPLQVSVTIGSVTPTTGAVPAAPAVSVTSAAAPATVNSPPAVVEEAAVTESVTTAYARFDATWLGIEGFSWKTVLATAVCSHLAYELPDVILATIRERFRMQMCQFVQTDDTVCFVAATEDRIVVSFRGTKVLADWLTDLNAFSTAASYGQLHRGFYFAFQAVKSSLERLFLQIGLNGRRIVLTGHSLGGALATVAAMEWQGMYDIASVYTYGQPRVGKADFVDFLERYLGSRFFRIVNDDDIVPRVPPGYLHAGQLFHFKPNGAVSQESIAADTADVEPPPLTEAEFAALKASLRLSPGAVTTEGIGLEGFFPSFSDHRLGNYLARILQQPL